MTTMATASSTTKVPANTQKKMERFQDLLDEAKRRIMLWTIFVFGLSFLLSLSSNYIFLNIPMAVLILAAVRYMSFDLEIRRRIKPQNFPPQLAHLLKHRLNSKNLRLQNTRVSTRWRRKVDSQLVETSIENFTHCIVKEFVTDLWLSSVTPDQDVPQQIESLINEVFGEIAHRVKYLNLIELMTRDLVDLASNHLDLFRQTKISIGVKFFETLSTEEREESLKKALKKTRKLHPALISPECEYKVLRRLTSGLVDILLKPQDAQCAILRGLARELLACAVLRPIMNFASPSMINKAIEKATASGKEKSQLNSSEKSTMADGNSSGKSSLGGSARENRNEQSKESSRIAMASSDFSGKQGDWAQVLDAMSKRRTNTLAPENLDNLWAKGRNYKKKEIKHGLMKPNQAISVSTHPFSSDLPDRLAFEKRNLKPDSGFSVSHSKYGNNQQSVESLKAEKPYYSVSSNAAVHHQHSSVQHSSQQEEQIFTDKLQAESHHSSSMNSESGLGGGWQKLKKPLANPEVNLNYWDNPGIHLSSSSIEHGQVTDWLNGHDGISKRSIDNPPASKLSCWVVGAHLEKISTTTFAVYSIAVTDSHNNTWFVERRFRNFEQLHRNLRDLHQYNLQLPPKRILSSSLDDAFVRDRCILLDKYLKDLLSIRSIAELHEVWDFLSVTSKKYSFTKSSSVMKTIAVNVDDAVDDMVRQLRGVSDGLFRQLGSPSSPPRDGNFPFTAGDVLKRPSVSTSGSYSTFSEKERLEQLSDDGFSEVIEDEGSHLADGWHSDSELQTSTSGQTHRSDFDKIDRRTGKRIKRVGSDLVPEESLAVLEPVEEDPEVPPEWTPPKLTIPLLNLVDGVFQLQRRGWLRRQVFWMAKQILQVGMGDAIDDWLVSQVQFLRREDVVASSINWVKGILWPEGIFITKIKKEDDVAGSNKQSTQKGIDQSAFFNSQLEASRCAQVVSETLVEGAPAALVSLVGKKQYRKCAKDIYHFLQSTIFLKQLTYSVLETLLAATFPELTGLIIDIRQGTSAVVI